MKKIILSILTLATINGNAQNFEWAKGIESLNTDIGNSIAVDASGNTYTTGYFNGVADFDPGAGVYNLTSAGSDDIFISKLDANGDFVWAKSMGGTSSEEGKSIAVNASGEVYITGFYQGTADFDPGAGVNNLTAAGSYDIFISKLDANGDFVWAKSISGSGFEFVGSIAIDASGNVYTTGQFDGPVDFDPSAGIDILTSAGQTDIFLSKLDANGNHVWAKSFGSTNGDWGSSVTIDDSENVYMTGVFLGTVDFDPGAGVNNLISTGVQDIFISKLDANGDFVWAKHIGGTGGTGAINSMSIITDDLGNIYTTGSFSLTCDFDPGAGTTNLTANLDNMFISKLDSNGDFVWAKSTNGADGGQANSIAVDDSGNVYTAGYFSGTEDFDPNAGVHNLTSAGATDVFISKLNIDGDFVWAKKIGNTGADWTNSIVVNSGGDIYITGYYTQTVNFDPGAGTNTLSSFASGKDIFILKWNQTNQSGVGVSENNTAFNIYPNPTTGLLNFETTEQINTIEIYNLTGQKVLEFTNQNTINISELTNGIYMTKIITINGQVSTHKIIKK